MLGTLTRSALRDQKQGGLTPPGVMRGGTRESSADEGVSCKQIHAAVHHADPTQVPHGGQGGWGHHSPMLQSHPSSLCAATCVCYCHLLHSQAIDIFQLFLTKKMLALPGKCPAPGLPLSLYGFITILTSLTGLYKKKKALQTILVNKRFQSQTEKMLLKLKVVSSQWNCEGKWNFLFYQMFHYLKVICMEKRDLKIWEEFLIKTNQERPEPQAKWT